MAKSRHAPRKITRIGCAAVYFLVWWSGITYIVNPYRPHDSARDHIMFSVIPDVDEKEDEEDMIPLACEAELDHEGHSPTDFGIFRRGRGHSQRLR
jgi:hypothetical protein